jgi:hypothetical protein
MMLDIPSQRRFPRVSCSWRHAAGKGENVSPLGLHVSSRSLPAEAKASSLEPQRPQVSVSGGGYSQVGSGRVTARHDDLGRRLARTPGFLRGHGWPKVLAGRELRRS